MSKPPGTPLRREEWFVVPVKLSVAQDLVQRFHYSHGGANTATYCHGLFNVKDPDTCVGVAWWIPPTKGAALATDKDNYLGVLSLSRLVLIPGLPTNSASYLLARSRALIDRTRWPTLVTYADECQGHKGSIYRADNWEYLGLTGAEARWELNGRMVARKAGPRTRTKAEMQGLGATMVGRCRKHKFRNKA